MSEKLFESIKTVINNRRTTKAHAMNSDLISDEQIQKLLVLADHAPSHRQTEPWRFIVFSGEALDKFGQAHADIYWEYTDEAKRRKSKYNKYIKYAKNASHVIVAIMRP